MSPPDAIVRCGGCHSRVAEMSFDTDVGEWRISTFPGVLARRMKEAFTSPGDELQIDSIVRHDRAIIRRDAPYALACGNCLRGRTVAGAWLVLNASRRRELVIDLTEPIHVDPIPDQPPETGSPVDLTLRDADGNVTHRATGHLHIRDGGVELEFDDGSTARWELPPTGHEDQ